MRRYLIPLALAALCAALMACGSDLGDDDFSGADVAGGAPTAAPSQAWQLSAEDLCGLLTADEVSNVLGRAVTANTDRFDGCHYRDTDNVAKLTETLLDAEEYAAFMPTLGAVHAESTPGGEVLSFDSEGLVFSAWFQAEDVALELSVAAGIAREQVEALIEAATS